MLEVVTVVLRLVHMSWNAFMGKCVIERQTGWIASVVTGIVADFVWTFGVNWLNDKVGHDAVFGLFRREFLDFIVHGFDNREFSRIALFQKWHDFTDTGEPGFRLFNHSGFCVRAKNRTIFRDCIIHGSPDFFFHDFNVITRSGIRL